MKLRFVRAMLRAGASGYILKDHMFKELSTGLRTVMNGHTYLGYETDDSEGRGLGYPR